MDTLMRIDQDTRDWQWPVGQCICRAASTRIHQVVSIKSSREYKTRETREGGTRGEERLVGCFGSCATVGVEEAE